MYAIAGGTSLGEWPFSHKSKPGTLYQISLRLLQMNADFLCVLHASVVNLSVRLVQVVFLLWFH